MPSSPNPLRVVGFWVGGHYLDPRGYLFGGRNLPWYHDPSWTQCVDIFLEYPYSLAAPE